MLYTAIFHGCKKDNFQMKNCYVFLIFAQNSTFFILVQAQIKSCTYGIVMATSFGLIINSANYEYLIYGQNMLTCKHEKLSHNPISS